MPTIPLWRICRVLANRPRLKMLALLSRRPALRVADIARALKLSRPAASQYLRALEACGFVTATRRRRSVLYAIAGRSTDPNARAMIDALITCLRDKTSIDSMFKLATAFANPGRIEVFRNLKGETGSFAALRASTGFHDRTLWRHLEKLRNRRFVCDRSDGKYEATSPPGEFARVLARAAAG